MKTKHLLLLYGILLLAVFTATAQTTKETVPFNKKLPPGYPKNFSGTLPPDNRKAGTNPALTMFMDALKQEQIKRDPNHYNQQIPQRQNNVLPSGRKTMPSTDRESVESSNANFHLTRDINSASASSLQISPDGVLSDAMYFADEDATHGAELWRSDGTVEGTYIVKDIEPGSASSNPADITAINGKLYFSANNEPWISDGTDGGTHLIKHVNLGFASGLSKKFTGVGNAVYFIAAGASGAYNTGVWKTDGTTAGTKLVRDIADDGTSRNDISQPMAANGLLYFTTYNYTTLNWELWRSDGTHNGTYAIEKSGTPFKNEPGQLTSYNNQLYFSADVGSGYKLWMSNGTSAGTKPAPGNHDVIISPTYGTAFPILNNVMYIPGLSSVAYNGALYQYDAGSGNGLQKVKDLTTSTNPDFIVPDEMAIVNNSLYFKVTNYNDGLHEELWTSRGNAENTKILQAFSPGEAIYNLVSSGGKLYFVNDNTLLGAELWVVVNTSSGKVLYTVSDIFKGAGSSYPDYLTAFKGKLFFAATENKKGAELFITGGTAATTSVVKSIISVATGSSDAGAYNGIVPVGNNVFFGAFENVHGFEFYKSDGTAGGTQLLNDIVPGPTYSYLQVFSAKNNNVYFLAYNPDGGFSIYKSDGTPSGLKRMTPSYDGGTYDFYWVFYNVAENGRVFYILSNFETGNYELWSSDGTASGTHLLSTTVYTDQVLLTVIGNTTFFVANDATHGYELWKSDGTIAGTSLVKDINPGSGDGAGGAFFAYKNELYFGAFDGTNQGFWKSDGTKKGTVKVKNIAPAGYGSIVFQNQLYFNAAAPSDTKGSELWKTDGTTAGTQAIKDINHSFDTYDDVCYYFTKVDSTLFFLSNDDVHGPELWKTDGSNEGTQMVKDITPGEQGSFINNLASYNGKLYFAIDNKDVWSSDGTDASTLPLNDPVLNKITEIFNVVATPGKLFVSGNTHRYGTELFAGTVDNQGVMTVANVATEKALKTQASFDAILSPNPTAANARLRLTGNAKDVSVSIADMSGKKLWQSSNINTMLISLPTARLAAGTYFITVINGKEIKAIKLVKQ